MGILKRYTRWLHTRWPAGTVEKLPQVRENFSTNVSGLYIVGDLTGVPLLKFSADSGARVVQTIVGDATFQKQRAAADEGLHDLVIIGGGVSGMAAALEARKHDLDFVLLEAAEPFSTIVNFPKGKPIYTYPSDMTPTGDLQFNAEVKEPLIAELRAQTLETGIEPRAARAQQVVRRGDSFEVKLAGEEDLRARRVIVAICRSGNFRKLGVPGEDKDKVYNRLHDPKDFCSQNILVVGGGDSALETAIACAQCGANVTISYRKAEFSRPKPDNVEQIEKLRQDPMADVAVEEPSSERVTTSAGQFLDENRKAGSITLRMGTNVKRIEDDRVVLADKDGHEETLDNAVVFSMIGREPPLEFFRRSGVRIRGELGTRGWVTFALFMLFCTWLYHWKSDAGIPVKHWFEEAHWFPFNVGDWFNAAGGAIASASQTPTNFLYTLRASMSHPSFYYTLGYCLCVVCFGIARIRRRKTPYVKLQTLTLMVIQVIPLFILPELLLPWAGRNGWFESGTAAGGVADQFFEPDDVPDESRLEEAGVASVAEYQAAGHPVGHERAYWRAYGFILAWPLFAWNLFTDQPMWGWLILGSIQTFVIIPLMIRRWGKGAYCGWICSCGALAETMGDTQRHKMPHGPLWNRLNMTGQVILAFASLLLLLRIVSWALPGSGIGTVYEELLKKIPLINYKWSVDLVLAGIVGLGCYFWFSGRVWCRFACPLAALMHIYARFSRFRILAEKKKCISCNVCTSVCHQGIDVMNFANKGLPMADPECVRCSACVQSCPTGVLEFGQVNPRTGEIVARDRVVASFVRASEIGKPY